MKTNFNWNKKNNIINIEFDKRQNFDFIKFYYLLNGNELTFNAERMQDTNKLKVFFKEFNNNCFLLTNISNFNQLNDIIENDKFATNLILVDGKVERTDDAFLLSAILENKFRFFIDFDYVNNKVFVIININDYNSSFVKDLKKYLTKN